MITTASPLCCPICHEPVAVTRHARPHSVPRREVVRPAEVCQ